MKMPDFETDENPDGNPLAGISKLEPDPEISRQSIGRVHKALQERIARKRWNSWLRRLAASSAACAAVGFIWWLVLGGFGGTTFAAVQVRVGRTHSVEFEMWDEDDPDEISKVRILEQGLMREDAKDGSYRVTDFKHRRILEVDPATKEARLFRGLTPRMRQNLYENIRDIPASSVEALASKTIDGKLARTYRARLKLDGLNEDEFLVWVDVQTLLPICMESTRVESGDKPVRTFITGIRFDEVQSSDVFSTEPPAGMEQTTIGLEHLQDPPSEASLKDLEIHPGRGLGNARLGRGTIRLLKALGKPDEIDPESGDWNYFSRGYSIQFDEKGRVDEIYCYCQEIYEMEVRDFAGHTKEGVRLGASRGTVEKVYGKATSTSEEDGVISLHYVALGLEFKIKNDHLAAITIRRRNE